MKLAYVRFDLVRYLLVADGSHSANRSCYPTIAVSSDSTVLDLDADERLINWLPQRGLIIELKCENSRLVERDPTLCLAADEERLGGEFYQT